MQGKKAVSSALVAAAAVAALLLFYGRSAGRRPGETTNLVPAGALPASFESAPPAALSSEPEAPAAEVKAPVVAASGWTLRGKLVDEKGAPIPAGQVTLRKTDGGEVLSRSRTAEDGAFSITDVAPRRKILLELEAPGRASRSFEGEIYQLPAGRNARLLDLDEIELGPPCDITVLLSAEDVGGVEGARIEIRPPGRLWANGVDFHLYERPKHLEASGEPGTYRAAGLAAGEYLLVFEDERYPFESWQIRLPREGPLRLTLKRSWSSTGTVTDPMGRPVAGARVLVTEAKADGTRRTAVTGPAGEFEAAGLSGTCLVDIVVEAEHFLRRVVREVPPGIDVPIRLMPGAVVTGKAITADGRPAPGARVWSHGGETRSGRDGFFTLTGLPKGYACVEVHHAEHGSYESEALNLGPEERRDLGRLVLKPPEGDLEGYEAPQAAAEVQRPRGTLRVEVVDSQGRPVPKAIVSFDEESWRTDRQGVLELRVAGAGGFTAEVRASGFFSKPAELEVEAGAARTFRIELEAAGSLEGRVLAGGQAVHRARVSVFGEGIGPLDRFDTDVDGRFSMGGLSRGIYRVYAEIREVYRSKADVIVEPGKTTSVGDIRLPSLPDEEVTGHVVDGDGRPIAGAFVSVSRMDDLAADLTDAQGSFRVRGLRRGKCDLDVRRTGFIFPGELIEAPASGLKLRLERDKEVQGQLIDFASGLPVAGATVFAFYKADILVGYRYTPEGEITDADGRFLFGSRARRSPIASLIIEAEGYADRFIVIRAEITEDLTVSLERAVLFRARVVDASGRPCPEARALLIDPRTGFHGRDFEADRSGDLECSFSGEGPRRLLVKDSGALHPFDVEVMTGAPPSLIRLAPPGKLRVRGSGPIADCDLEILRDGVDLNRQWRMFDPGSGSGHFNDYEAEGGVVFRPLAPGRYTCRARCGEAPALTSPERWAAVEVEVFSQRTTEALLQSP